MSEGAPHHDTGYGRQAFIVLLLTGGVILLHRFAVPTGVDPTAMLALGFLILASYTIGELVGAIKVPHITGYLAAGLFFGPSAAHYLGQVLPFPPFQEGILSTDVIESLRIFDTLAVALIALTAGGELKIAGLKKGFKVILGILGGQIALLFVLVTGVIWLVSGPLPFAVIPEIAAVGSLGALGLGLVVASISVATSPAATIAVINSTGSKGPMTRAVLSTVVLKDVIVVVAFSIASALAAAFIGISSDDQNLWTFLAVHIGGSIVVGVGVGFALSLYLRYVGRETLLVIVGVVYAATLLATSLHLDPVLLFMAAGFTASNFSREGDTLIHNVERLSMPVYVIFFTLAGAGLHLDALAIVGPVAAVIVIARLAALYVGVGVGARISGADDGTKRYGWLGFASQAGVAITLAAKVGNDFGDVGEYLESVIITGVAINELIGPILLKAGLGLSGEIATRGREEPTHDGMSSPPPSKPVAKEVAPAPLSEWPVSEAASIGANWARAETSSDALNAAAGALREELREVVRRIVRGPLENQRRGMELYLRDLRREFLKHHRRLTVQVRNSDEEVVPSFHREEAELAERWRTLVLERAAEVRGRFVDLSSITYDLDAIADDAPQRVRAPYEAEAFTKQDDEGTSRTLSRALLKTRRALGGGTPEREVEVRGLARYHFASVAAGLESIAALLVHGDAHLAARTKSLFEHIHRGYATLRVDDGEPAEERLRALRASIDDELALSLEEAARITRDAAARLDEIAGEAFAGFAADLASYGTPDLPASRRRSSEAFERRVAAEKALGARVDEVLAVVAARYSRLGLQLELVGFEARMKEMLDEQVRALEQDVHGRTHTQAERLSSSLAEARAAVESELKATDRSAQELSTKIRELFEPIEKVCTEAEAKAQELEEQLSEEASIAPVLEGLRRAAIGLGESYTAPVGELGPPGVELPTGASVVVVPFRELVSAHIEAQVAPDLLGAARAMAATVEPLVSAFAEVERLLAFNVEVASTELDDAGDDVVSSDARELLEQILFGAFDRAEEIVEARANESADWSRIFGGELRQAVLGGVAELERQLTADDLSGDRINLLRRRAAGQRLTRKAEALPSLLARARHLAKRSVQGLLGTTRIDAWRRALGLPRPRRDTRAEVFHRPQSQTEIPLVYRRLFAARTVESADVLTGRDQAIADARKILRGKGSGALRTVALVGPDGVGKGALARAVVRTRAFKHVRHLSLEGPATVEDVDAWFGDGATGQLFVVSDFKFLMAMRAGGFAPLRRFVEGVVADQGRNAWLIHADELVWRVASQAASVADAFPTVIAVPALGPRELEAAVLARHGLSGYGLSFEHRAEGSGLDDLLVRAAVRVRRPYEAYFRALHDVSGGLVRDALALWLSSIDEVNDTADYVHVGPMPPSVEPAIDALPEDVLLNLLQVARQGWVDAEVQAHVYRLERTDAAAQLARLSNMGLLERDGAEAYAIPVHLRGPVNRVLRARGWVR